MLRAPLLLVALLVAGCSGGGTIAPSPTTATATGAIRPSGSIAVTVTPAGCSAAPDIATSGNVTFRMHNQGAGNVNSVLLEFSSGQPVDEQLNLIPGNTAVMTAHLVAGAYLISCPGSTVPTTALGVVDTPSSAAAVLATGVKSFTAALHAETATALSATQTLVSAISMQNLAAAARAYPPARVAYEQIAQFVEGSGLDLAIDGPIVRFSKPAAATGFHRIEYAIWGSRSLAGMDPVASSLLNDMRQAAATVTAADPAAADVANAAVSSLTEVATTGMEGELEPYSGLTLFMAEGDLHAAVGAYQPLRPALSAIAPALTTMIDERISTTAAALQSYSERSGADGTGYPDFAQVGPAQRAQLAQTFLSLASAMSMMTSSVLP